MTHVVSCLYKQVPIVFFASTAGLPHFRNRFGERVKLAVTLLTPFGSPVPLFDTVDPSKKLYNPKQLFKSLGSFTCCCWLSFGFADHGPTTCFAWRTKHWLTRGEQKPWLEGRHKRSCRRALPDSMLATWDTKNRMAMLAENPVVRRLVPAAPRQIKERSANLQQLGK